MPEIVPNKLHFIWVGCAVPLHLLDNLFQWAFQNPAYIVYLWTEAKCIPLHKDTITQLLDEHIAMEWFDSYAVNAAGFDTEIAITKNEETFGTITIAAFNRLKLEVDPSFIYEELTEWKNYGATSDLLRYSILYSEGGIYMDFDTYSTSERIPTEISPPREILITFQREGQMVGIANAVIACPQHSEKMRKIIDIVNENYERVYLPVQQGVYEFAEHGRTLLNRIQYLREEIATLGENSFIRDRYKDELAEHMLEYTRNRSGPSVITDFLVYEEKVDLDSAELELYSFSVQTNCKIFIDSETAWLK